MGDDSLGVESWGICSISGTRTQEWKYINRAVAQCSKHWINTCATQKSRFQRLGVQAMEGLHGKIAGYDTCAQPEKLSKRFVS